MANQINIVVGADVNAAISGLKQVETQTQRTFQKVDQSSGAATQSLINLSRVAQDAPFGFIGIANNLNPLLESFQRLKAQTGSTGGALKSLVAGLAGPAGLGLAVGVGSALLVTFGDKLFGAGKAAKQAKDEIAEFNKSVDQAKASALSTGLQLQSFVDIAKNGTLPIEQRNEALKKANDILGKYGQTLTLTNVATETATELVKNYTNGLIAQALAAQYADRIGKLLIDQASAQKQVTQAQIEYNKAQTAFVNRPNLSVRDQELGRGQVFIVARDNALNKLNESQKQYGEITKQVTDLTADFNKQAAESTKLLGEIGTKPLKVKVDKNFDEFKYLENRFKEFEKVLLGTRASNDAQLRIGIAGITFVPTPTLYQRLQSETVEILSKGFPEAFKPKIAADVSPELKAFGNEFVKGIDQINNAIESLQVDSLSKLGEAIGTAFSGGEIKNVFQGFVDTISGAITAIGKQMIALGVKAALLKKSLSTLFSNPLALVAAGVGLVAVGSAIRGVLSKGIEGREKGGPVSGNTPYIVGERGPELFVPAVGGSIIPNNRLGSFNGRPAFAASMGGRSIVRGTDILLASARSQRSINRVNA